MKFYESYPGNDLNSSFSILCKYNSKLLTLNLKWQFLISTSFMYSPIKKMFKTCMRGRMVEGGRGKKGKVLQHDFIRGRCEVKRRVHFGIHLFKIEQHFSVSKNSNEYIIWNIHRLCSISTLMQRFLKRNSRSLSWQI